MKRLLIGILAFVFATTFVMPVQAQETGEDAAETAEAVAQDAADATGEAVQEAGEDAAAAVQEAGEDAAAAAGDELEEVSEAAEDAYQGAADDADGYAADNEWLWILGLAGAFIIVWFLLRRRKARREG